MTMENLARGKKEAKSENVFNDKYLCLNFSLCQDLTQQSTNLSFSVNLFLVVNISLSVPLLVQLRLVIMLEEQRIIRINFTASTTTHFITVC